MDAPKGISRFRKLAAKVAIASGFGKASGLGVGDPCFVKLLGSPPAPSAAGVWEVAQVERLDDQDDGARRVLLRLGDGVGTVSVLSTASDVLHYNRTRGWSLSGDVVPDLCAGVDNHPATLAVSLENVARAFVPAVPVCGNEAAVVVLSDEPVLPALPALLRSHVTLLGPSRPMLAAVVKMKLSAAALSEASVATSLSQLDAALDVCECLFEPSTFAGDLLLQPNGAPLFRPYLGIPRTDGPDLRSKCERLGATPAVVDAVSALVEGAAQLASTSLPGTGLPPGSSAAITTVAKLWGVGAKPLAAMLYPRPVVPAATVEGARRALVSTAVAKAAALLFRPHPKAAVPGALARLCLLPEVAAEGPTLNQYAVRAAYGLLIAGINQRAKVDTVFAALAPALASLPAIVEGNPGGTPDGAAAKFVDAVRAAEQKRPQEGPPAAAIASGRDRDVVLLRHPGSTEEHRLKVSEVVRLVDATALFPQAPPLPGAQLRDLGTLLGLPSAVVLCIRPLLGADRTEAAARHRSFSWLALTTAAVRAYERPNSTITEASAAALQLLVESPPPPEPTHAELLERLRQVASVPPTHLHTPATGPPLVSVAFRLAVEQTFQRSKGAQLSSLQAQLRARFAVALSHRRRVRCSAQLIVACAAAAHSERSVASLALTRAAALHRLRDEAERCAVRDEETGARQAVEALFTAQHQTHARKAVAFMAPLFARARGDLEAASLRARMDIMRQERDACRRVVSWLSDSWSFVADEMAAAVSERNALFLRQAQPVMTSEHIARLRAEREEEVSRLRALEPEREALSAALKRWRALRREQAATDRRSAAAAQMSLGRLHSAAQQRAMAEGGAVSSLVATRTPYNVSYAGYWAQPSMP